ELSATFTIDSCWIMVGLPYRARSMISTTRHRLSFDKGLVSTMRTVSPTFAEFSSSWAFRRFVRVTILPYTGCGTRRSIATTTVFCILSLTTRPVRVLREPRSSAAVWLLVVVELAIGLFRHFPQHGLETRDVPADDAQAKRILEGLGRAPELQAKLFLFQVPDACGDVILAHLSDFFSS